MRGLVWVSVSWSIGGGSGVRWVSNTPPVRVLRGDIGCDGSEALLVDGKGLCIKAGMVLIVVPLTVKVVAIMDGRSCWGCWKEILALPMLQQGSFVTQSPLG